MSDTPGIGHNNPPPIRLTPVEMAAHLLESEAKLLDRRNALQEAVPRFQTKMPTIEDEEQLGLAGDFLKQLNALLAVAKEHYEREKAPYWQTGKAVDAFFAAIIKPMEAAVLEIKRPMTAYSVAKAARERADRIEASKRAQAEAAAAQKAITEGSGTIEAAIATAQAADVAAKQAAAPAAEMTRARGDYGSVTSLRETWDVELEDLSKVPADYLTFNDVKARAAVKAGLRAIPGCRVFQRQSVATR